MAATLSRPQSVKKNNSKINIAIFSLQPMYIETQLDCNSDAIPPRNGFTLGNCMIVPVPMELTGGSGE